MLWSARYPCRVSVSDRPPVLSLPGALAITPARAANFSLATGSILTGHSWCNYCGGGQATAYPRGPTFVPRPISVFSQPRHFDVAEVCTLPLPDNGL